MGQSDIKEISPVPIHVAVIMDGNGRWAQNRGLNRLAGHRAGTENIRRIIRTFGNYGVKYLTLYAFSTENWNRPEEEVKGLFQILADVIDRETENLHKEALARIRNMGLSETIEPHYTQRVTKDGRNLQVWMTATALLNEAGEVYAIATTERARRAG